MTSPEKPKTDEIGLPDTVRLLTLKTIAAAADSSLRSVQVWVKTRELPTVRLGRSVRVRVSDWTEFLRRRQTP